MATIIAIDGMSGAGKGTLQPKLERAFSRAYFDVVSLQEPSSFLREFIQHYRTSGNRDPYVELNLFTADRKHQELTQIDSSYDQENKIFLKDRSWVSTFAYQGILQGVPLEHVIASQQHLKPLDLALILIADPEVALQRIEGRELSGMRGADEQLDKLRILHDAYIKAASYIPNAVLIDANNTPEEIYYAAKKAIREKLGYLQPGIFLDKDGTIVKNYLGHPHGTIATDELLNDAIEGIQQLLNVQGKKIIVSNQPWIGYKRMSLQEIEAVFVSVKEKFLQHGATLDDYYYCIHSRQENCPEKKPASGMIEKGIRQYHLDREASWMIGDTIDDVVAGKGANVKTMLVLSGVMDRKEEHKQQADYVRSNFSDAVKFIIKQQQSL